MTLRIAVLAHPRHPIAPPFRGGMEAHAWHLVDGLAERGHEVTLFASGDSAQHLPSGVTLEPLLPRHYEADFPWQQYRDTPQLVSLLDQAYAAVLPRLTSDRFDVVHNNTLHRYPPRHACATGMAMVTSLHVPPFPVLARAVGNGGAPWSRFTVTSSSHCAAYWPDRAATPDYAHIVANGIDLSRWPYRPGGDGSAIWAGRLTSTKGVERAIHAAKLAGRELRIFGAIDDPEYFETVVSPKLTGSIRYGGHLSPAELADEYGRSSALLFTPLWDEPFGLAAVEAMATGLPVAAINRGAVREVVGEAGAIVSEDAPDDLANALDRTMDIPPAVPRRRVSALFTLDRMLDGYANAYAAALNNAREVATYPKRQYTQTELPMSA